MQPLSVLDAPLDTLTLVEASAGTGKTYAIAGLYLRLVVETDIRVPEILVVTYTRAATEELRDRIRQRLVLARDILQGSATTTDGALAQLLERASRDDGGRSRRRLEAALLAFDEAAIHTIHGFCQRVLADAAFASAMPLSTELVTDDSALVLEIVEDFWRRRLFRARPGLVRQVLDKGWSPDSLCRELRPLLGKPYLQLVTAEGAGDPEALEPPFLTALEAARDCWLAEREVIEDLLTAGGALSGTKYPRKSLPDWLTSLQDWLEEEAPDPRPPKHFEKFTTSGLAAGVNKGKTPPTHRFFDLCQTLQQAAQALQAAFDGYLSTLFRDLLLTCQAELPRLKRQYKVQSYDDLLVNLHQALHHPEGGEKLAAALRQRYRAGLIDEFQDTDPVQYRIFHTLYADSGCPVFLVGDPKQAIYSFRGADIHAYLQAQQAVGAAYTLDTNYRSDPVLVNAVNRLFADHKAPFLMSRIPFQPVQAADRPRQTLILPDGTAAPLCLWFQPPRDDGKRHTKADMSAAAVAAVAGRIARILSLADAGEARLGDRPVQGSDMAVLVRTNAQALALREALLARGVASVLHSPDSVFETVEATEFERLLAALLQPRREDLLRAALLGDCLGWDLAGLEALGRDDGRWEALLQRFADYHQQWREQGFMRMFRRLLVAEGVYRRLLAQADGERRLTNLLHLAELAQAASLDQRLGQEGLLAWLVAQRDHPSVAEEDRQLRLESDAALVRLVTIHKAKGLEYPIVFCPFLWDGRLGSEKQTIIRCHDPQDQDRPVLDLGSAELDRRRRVALQEELAEQLRLTYVALTRARHRCYVVCGAVSQLEKSALGWLLHAPSVVEPGLDQLAALERLIKSLKGEGWLSGPRALAKAAPEAVAVETLPAETHHYRPPAADPTPLQARRFPGTPPLGWCFSSFSALQSRHGGGVADYDPGQGTAPSTLDAVGIHGFPRGTRAGRCFHALLEQLDFQQPVAVQRDLVARQLVRHGFEAHWEDTLVAALQRTLDTPVATGWRLADLGGEARLNELNFVYRMARLGAEDLRGLLAEHGMDGEIPDFAPQRGFMRGVVDLLCQVGGGFQLLDYKSNWLGPGLQDYHPQALAQAMTDGDYHLQSLIYTVAVDRYLRWRVKDYDYARDFGGVYYLFLRGMEGETTGAGVHACRPPPALIAALDDYLDLRYP